MSSTTRTRSEDPIAVWLLKSRKAAGLGQKDISALMGVAQSTFSRWENGAKPPPTDRIRQAYEIFTHRAPDTEAPPLFRTSSRRANAPVATNDPSPTANEAYMVPVVGTMLSGGVVRYSAESIGPPEANTEGPAIERVPAPPGMEGLDLCAFRIETDGLMPFGRGWLLFTPSDRPDDIDAAVVDRLAVVHVPMQGPLLGWLRRSGDGGGYLLDRINSPPVPIKSVNWAVPVVDIRPA